MEVDFQTPSTRLRYVENSEQGDQEGTVVNLHPEFPVLEHELHQDAVFPGMAHTTQLHKTMMEHGVDPLAFSSIEEAREYRKRNLQESEDWNLVKKAWSLHLKGRPEIAQQFLNQYQHDGFDAEPTMNEVLYHFFSRIIGFGKEYIFINAMDFVKLVYDGNPSEFLRFRKEYVDRFHEPDMQRYFDIATDYFKDYSEFNQTLKYSQIDQQLPKGSKASSTAFRKTKMFYGNLFEAITVNYLVLACLNNISKGRSYDQFEQMDLKKYLTINKANRSNPFKDTPPLNVFADCILSELRNASHHGAMKISARSGVVSYRSGDTGNEKTISYAEYLFACNELFIRFITLLMVELAIVGK